MMSSLYLMTSSLSMTSDLVGGASVEHEDHVVGVRVQLQELQEQPLQTQSPMMSYSITNTSSSSRTTHAQCTVQADDAT